MVVCWLNKVFFEDVFWVFKLRVILMECLYGDFEFKGLYWLEGFLGV